MRRRPKPSSFLLTLRLRSRSSWASWRLRRTTRRLLKEQRRTLLLQLSLDSSLLRQKELEQLVAQYRHRLQEMAEARAFRLQGQVPEPPTEEPLIPPVLAEPVLADLGQMSTLLQAQQERRTLPPDQETVTLPLA